MIVAHDFNLNLELYRLPKQVKEMAERVCNIQIVDIQDAKPQDIEVFWGNRITTSQIYGYPNLRWVHLGCSGTDRIDLGRVLTTHAFSRSAEILSSPVASTAIMFMYALGRGLQWSLQHPHRSYMDDKLESIVNMKRAKTLVLGRGGVAKAIQSTLGASKCHLMPARNLNTDRVHGYDFIVNTLPLTEGTLGVINFEWFKNMDPTTYFINVGRGETVNEDHLIQAIKDKEIMGAGIDVVQDEPMGPNHPIVQMEEVLATPHIAWYSRTYWEDELELFSRKLRRYRHRPSTGWV